MENFIENMFKDEIVLNNETKMKEVTLSLVKDLNRSVKSRKGKQVTEKELLEAFYNKMGGGSAETIDNSACSGTNTQCNDSITSSVELCDCGQKGGSYKYDNILNNVVDTKKKFKISNKHRKLLENIVYHHYNRA